MVDAGIATEQEGYIVEMEIKLDSQQRDVCSNMCSAVMIEVPRKGEINMLAYRTNRTGGFSESDAVYMK